MPILYACLINKKRTIISESFATRIKGDFSSEILNYFDKFERYGKKFIVLSAEQKLAYRNQKDYTVCCIINSYDIKDLEA